MNLRLQISRNIERGEFWQQPRFRIAVIDLDKAEIYPRNFVCLLPVKVSSNVNKLNVFEKRFGDESLEVAKNLLAEALKSEDNKDARSEIERRLKLLEPKPFSVKNCASCGKTFAARKNLFKQRYCEDCLRKKFGSV